MLSLSLVHISEGVAGGILEMLEAVSHEFYVTEPAGDDYNAVGDVGGLEESEDDHASTGFAVVVFGLVDDAFVGQTGSPAIVVGFLVLFFTF